MYNIFTFCRNFDIYCNRLWHFVLFLYLSRSWLRPCVDFVCLCVLFLRLFRCWLSPNICGACIIDQWTAEKIRKFTNKQRTWNIRVLYQAKGSDLCGGMCVSVPVSPSFCLSVFLSVCLSVFLSVAPNINVWTGGKIVLKYHMVDFNSVFGNSNSHPYWFPVNFSYLGAKNGKTGCKNMLNKGKIHIKTCSRRRHHHHHHCYWRIQNSWL
jgi:hypothetical protein